MKYLLNIEQYITAKKNNLLEAVSSEQANYSQKLKLTTEIEIVKTTYLENKKNNVNMFYSTLVGVPAKGTAHQKSMGLLEKTDEYEQKYTELYNKAIDTFNALNYVDKNKTASERLKSLSKDISADKLADLLKGVKDTNTKNTEFNKKENDRSNMIASR